MLRVLWKAGFLALLCTPPAWSQDAADAPPLPVHTPAEVRRDGDGDGQPDLAGARVRVAGRASLPARLEEDRFNTALQSGSAGLTLVGAQVTTPVAPGDSLDATGTLVFRNGQLHLRVDTYRVVPGERRPPAPRLLRLDTLLEPFEGMLVAFEATAVARRRIAIGTILTLAAQDSLLYALAFGDTGTRLFGHVHTGEHVRVVGVLGQHDTAPPYLQGYQVYPASPEDVRVRSKDTAFYRRVALVVVVLLVLALGVIAFLQARSRRRLARQLQSEHRYRLLFEHTDDAVFVHEVTGEGFDGLRLLACNPAAEKLFGVSQQGLQDMSLRAFLDDPAAAADALGRLQQDDRLTMTVPMHRADGTPMTVEVDAFLVREDSRRLLMSLLTDVTQRTAYEQGLVKARERAEAYARLQQSFVANMSHEIRTPLTGIIGFADVLREELDGEQRQFAEMIELGARRLLETLDGILEIARLEAHGETISLHPTDLARALREATATLDVLARQRGVVLRVEAPDALVVPSSAHAFGRIVTNLVGNALKFTPEGGEVVATLQPEGREAVLVVRDTGIGISEAFLAQLFDPFTQEPDDADRPQGGTGLGLAITQRLVRMLGGTIGVESRKGEGSTFIVRLPLPVSTTVSEPAAALG